jgi:molybdenum cofactor synthesis domain-containing protein
MKALVVTCSNRAAAGVYEDTTGPMIVEALRAWGFETGEPLVVPDGLPVEEALREAVDLRYEAVVTTGGTGISPTDATPEATADVLDRVLPGVAEAIRAYGVAAGVPTAMLSRGLAGVADQTVIVNLPGSRGGVRDGLAVLEGVLVHAVEQVAGVDHVRAPDGPDLGGAS